MPPKNRLKNDFCLMLCCGLSMSVIMGIIYWLDNDGKQTVTADAAYHQAQQSLTQYCDRNGMSSCDMKLVDAAAPSSDGSWSFRFYSASAGPVNVEVKDGSNADIASGDTVPR